MKNKYYKRITIIIDASKTTTIQIERDLYEELLERYKNQPQSGRHPNELIQSAFDLIHGKVPRKELFHYVNRYLRKQYDVPLEILF